MSKTLEKIFEVNHSLKVFGDASSDVIGAFRKLRTEACSEKGALDFKTKELIAIAVSVSRKCEPCILSHLKVITKMDISREELVPLIMTGGLSKSNALLDTISQAVKLPVVTREQALFAGAIGACICAKNKKT